MKAAICERYGPPEVVQIREVPQPVPAAGEVLIRARATTVNSGDARVRALRVPRGLRLPMRLKLGFTKPKQPILGLEVAGQVEAVGSAVTRFQPGDRVVASRGFDLASGQYGIVHGWTKPQRVLLAAVLLSVIIVVADVLLLNISGELPSEAWWWVAVPVGLFLVPVVGAVCLIALVGQRRRT